MKKFSNNIYVYRKIEILSWSFWNLKSNSLKNQKIEMPLESPVMIQFDKSSLLYLDSKKSNSILMGATVFERKLLDQESNSICTDLLRELHTWSKELQKIASLKFKVSINSFKIGLFHDFRVIMSV